MTKAEAARHLGKSKALATAYAQKHGLVFAVAGEGPCVAAWRECAEAGMSLTEAAKHLGRCNARGCYIAKRHGLKFRVTRVSRKERKPTVPRGVRAILTDKQRAEYDALVRSKGYRKAEALQTIGRIDLVAA